MQGKWRESNSLLEILLAPHCHICGSELPAKLLARCVQQEAKMLLVAVLGVRGTMKLPVWLVQTSFCQWSK